MFRADYRGFLHERPSTAVGIFQLALDDPWLGFIADVPDNYDLDSQRRRLPRSAACSSPQSLLRKHRGRVASWTS
jgi:hypothetical protein